MRVNGKVDGGWWVRGFGFRGFGMMEKVSRIAKARRRIDFIFFFDSLPLSTKKKERINPSSQKKKKKKKKDQQSSSSPLTLLP